MNHQIFSTSSPLCDREMARDIAAKLFGLYDRDGSGTIEKHEMGTIIDDAYKTINKSAKFNGEDIEVLAEVMDRDKDGRVTLNDMERLVSKYLLNSESSLY